MGAAHHSDNEIVPPRDHAMEPAREFPVHHHLPRLRFRKPANRVASPAECLPDDLILS